MKNLLVILILTFTFNAFSNTIDTIQINSKITDVTVFFNGAQVSRSFELTVNKGKHIILIDELPMEINSQSIQVEGNDNCKILSVKHQLKSQVSNNKTNEVLEIEEKIEAKKLSIKNIKNQSSVFDLEEKLLLDNSKLGNKYEGSSITQIKEAADFYRSRLNEIKLGKLNLSVEFEKINQELLDLYTELNKLITKKRRATSQILVTLDCEKDISTDLKLSYYVSSAGWVPLYDFRVDNITKPLTIVYNANIYQSSGEDWNNIKINLSTGNPSLNGNKPELTPWHLGRRVSNKTRVPRSGIGAIKGTVRDSDTDEAIPFANIIVLQGNKQIAGATSDFDGNYLIKPLPSGIFDLKSTFVGYQTKVVRNIIIEPNNIRFMDIKLQSSSERLDAVEIMEYKVPLIDKDRTSTGATISANEIRRMPNRSASSMATTVGGAFSYDNNVRGSRGNTESVYIDGIRVVDEIETLNYISNTLRTTAINVEYKIDIPYTIPSDGEDYNIKIKEVIIPVDYVNYAIPKLENDVFLTAEIVDWNQLDLLSGKSSIYYQGTFTGESAINSDNTSDTLSVSLGRDNKIILEREGNKEMIEKRIIGNYIKETIGWDITIKNNKSVKTKIIVEDQFPISDKKSIVVELLESGNAQINNKTGKLIWKIELKPNEKKVITFSYSVKYPKYTNLLIE